ncbi:MAG TPA: single-stranded-DNA-specific exonuclease RecJ [Candidatus Dojkabacteria bacterium]|nr:single-stranded-DNA-specific exonuclease RecJ [Candidatus Dojkabacteria bacterium]
MKWQLAPKIPDAERKKLSNYSDILAQLLYNRGINDADSAGKYLFAKETKLYNPYLLPDIKKAAAAILDAVKNHKKIVIYGDYDVDGISASSILFDFLYRELHADVVPYIPNRFDEGYGLSSIGLDALIKQNADLIITVDCGIRDHDLVAEYVKKGLQFIITDHHEFAFDKNKKAVLPEKALAMVHPGLPQSKYPFKFICGTAVAWKLLLVIADLAGKAKLLTRKANPEKYLDLVALATVCDCMDLVDENRLLVKKGLEVMRNSANLGLVELMQTAKITPGELDTYQLGYLLGPRLNAAGRVEHALDGVRLLTANNRALIASLAEKLQRLNASRQELTKKMLMEAEAQIELNQLGNKKLLFVYQEGWSEGVVGLVAGKISEKYHRPALAASVSKQTIKGSARSIPGFNITKALAQTAEKLERFGGHAAAAGFHLHQDNLADFISAISEIADQQVTEAMMVSQLFIDMEISPEDFTRELLVEIFQMRPFGIGNFEPTLLIRNLKVLNKQQVGKEKQHLKVLLKNPREMGNALIDAIGFYLGERADAVNPGENIDVVGQIMLKEWNGKEYLQLKLKDFQSSDS